MQRCAAESLPWTVRTSLPGANDIAVVASAIGELGGRVVGAELIADHGHVVGDRPAFGTHDVISDGGAATVSVVALERIEHPRLHARVEA